MKIKKINDQIYTEASDWLVEFRCGDVDLDGRKHFHRWLKLSPEHMRAYLELAAIWNEGNALDGERQFDDVRLARDLASETNITVHPSTGARNPAPKIEGEACSVDQSSRHVLSSFIPTRNLAQRVVAMGGAFVLAIVALGVWYVSVRDTYGTGFGEERMFTLRDGSTIELNSNSRVRVRFSKGVRRVELLAGQALFHVAKDRSRPFIVQSNTLQIRAVGTQFDVYRNRAATTVTVVEGTVAVLPEESPSPQVVVGSIAASAPTVSTLGVQREGELLLTAGEQVTVAPAKVPEPVKTDVAVATAWTQHELIFKGTPLADVTEEFNRYNRRHFVVNDAQIAKLKVTGIFSSTDPSSLIRFLEGRSDVAVTESNGEIVVSRKP